MRRLLVLLASLIATLGVLGCGGSDLAPVQGPAGDNRTADQKEQEDLMQKALEKARKGAPGRR
jgi:hypothetical protein